MSSIKGKLSTVEKLLADNRKSYNCILDMAEEELSKISRYEANVDNMLSNLRSKIMRVQSSMDDIDRKGSQYRRSMDEASREIDRCDERISDIYSNPIEVTKRDDDGNEYTTKSIDYDALYSAQRSREESSQNLDRYTSGFDGAQRAKNRTTATYNELKDLEATAQRVLAFISHYKFEMKKYITSAQIESEHNIQSLTGVIESMQSYLASKSIYMPIGTRYDEFANESSSSEASSFSNASSSNSASFVDHINDNEKKYTSSNVYKESLAYAGIENSPEIQEKMIKHLETVLSNSDISMRVKHSVLPLILDDGKFKNCFETGTSCGSLDFDGRKQASKELFGSDTSEETLFEKYGYLETKEPSCAVYPLSQYGGVIVKFKRDAVNASFSCGDSLGYHQNKENGGIGVSTNSPSLASMNKYQMKTLADAIKNGQDIPTDPHNFAWFLEKGETALSGKGSPQYIEVQLHGPLGIDAIESITFIDSWGSPDAFLTQKLDSLGIPYKVARLLD